MERKAKSIDVLQQAQTIEPHTARTVGAGFSVGGIVSFFRLRLLDALFDLAMHSP